MSLMTSERTTAKRNDETVRVDATVLRKARVLAADLGVSLAEYLSDRLHPIVDREYTAFLDRETKSGKPKR